MPESTPAQISRILAGDREAVAWLYDGFAPRLLRRLSLRFGSFRGLDPEDLLQDTFLYVLGRDGRVLRPFLDRDPGNEPEESDLDHFLWSAACGIASNRWRSILRHPAAPIEGREELRPTPGIEDGAVARDVLERLGDCLLKSGDRHYLYFQLRYLDGHKTAEIAEITGWSRRMTYKLKQAPDEALDLCARQLGIVEADS